MSSKDPQTWERARKARDKLAGRLMANPEVSQVAIGYDPESGESAVPASIVLRVEVRSQQAIKALGLPDDIDGFPVRVEVVSYRPE